MALPKPKAMHRDRRVGAYAGFVENVQSIALSGASTAAGKKPHATEIRPYGLTTIRSTGTGAGWLLTLGAPVKGMRKRIAIQQASTVPVTIQTHSSAVTFFGTTANTVAMSTAFPSDRVVLELQAVTSTSWLIAAPSTLAVSLAAAAQNA